MAERNYTPSGPTLQAFHDDPAFVRLIFGPVGAAKSSACFCEMLKLVHQQPLGSDGRRHARIACLRNTYDQLLSTVVKTADFWLPQSLGRFTQAPFQHRVRTGDLDLEILFVAADRVDDVQRLLSLELSAAWLCEVSEIPLAILNMLTTRVGRFPPMVEGGFHRPCIVADSHRPDTDSELYRLTHEAVPANWGVHIQPPAVVKDGDRWVENPAAENRENLPNAYYANALQGKPEAWIRKYLANEPIFLGDDRPVWPQFVDHVHVATGRLEPLPSSVLIVGIDFGLTPAATVCQQAPNGQWRVLSELVSDDMGAVRFGQALKQHLRQSYPGMKAMAYGDPAGGQRSQVDERTAFEAIRRHADIQCHSAGSNDFLLRVEVVTAALGRMIDGKPGLIVDPECRTLRKALAGGYSYRRVMVGGNDARYADKPTKNQFSHVAESLQYAVLGAGGKESVLPPRKQQGRRPQYAVGTGDVRLGGYGGRAGRTGAITGADMAGWDDDRPRFAKT